MLVFLHVPVVFQVYSLLCFESRVHCVDQTGVEFIIILPYPRVLR